MWNLSHVTQPYCCCSHSTLRFFRRSTTRSAPRSAAAPPSSSESPCFHLGFTAPQREAEPRKTQLLTSCRCALLSSCSTFCTMPSIKVHNIIVFMQWVPIAVGQWDGDARSPQFSVLSWILLLPQDVGENLLHGEDVSEQPGGLPLHRLRRQHHLRPRGQAAGREKRRGRLRPLQRSPALTQDFLFPSGFICGSFDSWSCFFFWPVVSCGAFL